LLDVACCCLLLLVVVCCWNLESHFYLLLQSFTSAHSFR
jgi:hypothetical protein